jgi:hypothetical protein
MIRINFSPSEVLHLIEVVLRGPMQDQTSQKILIEKLKNSVIEPLNSIGEKETIDLYGLWEDKQKERISALKTNEDLRVRRGRFGSKK